MDELRTQIDELDQEILMLLSKRMTTSAEIAKLKATENLPVEDLNREKQIMDRLKQLSNKYNLSSEFIEKVYNEILLESKKIQSDT